MINKNNQIEVLIESYGSDGQGIARYNNFVVFVPFSIIGEKVRVHIIYVSKTYAVGKIVEIIEPATIRRKAECPYFEKCGGCSVQHIKYNGAIEMKKQIVKDAFNKIAGIDYTTINDVVVSDNEFKYRNKSAFPICIKDGKVEVSMYKRLSHDNVLINECPITNDLIVKSANVFTEFANIYLNDKEKASLKYFVVRCIDNNLLITIVLNKFSDKFNKFAEFLINSLNLNKENVGIYLCKKNIENNVILEGDLKHIFGISAITTRFLGVEVEISPFSFFQVNTNVMEKLYQYVIDNINDGGTIVDTYSGAGLMSAMLSKKAEKVYAIEIVKQATENANYLKKVNKINNLININGDVSIELPKLVEKIKNNFTLVVDPPRKGVSSKVLDTILENEPKKIIYVSCDPATLARDVKILSTKYKIDVVQPFDMFPQTAHVETVAVLSSKVR